MLGSVRAVLFDMDGTLVDSNAAVARAWKVWAQRHGVDYAELMRVSPGLPGAAVIRHFRPQWSDQRVADEARAQLELEYVDLADVVPTRGAAYVLDTVAALGLEWAVVTSADRRLAHTRLAAAGIEAPLVVTREDVTNGKPDPESYRTAAERLGVDPAWCLVVEDAEPGVAAGRAAGMRVAGLYGVGGDLPIADLDELARLLRADQGPAEWWRSSVGYQVYLPSFVDSDGDGWGDLPGVTSRLDYLADLLDAAHGRGIRVLADLVVNHTSDRHRWFERSRSSRGNPYRDYYIWRDPAPDGGPPNNWLSHFGGPAWTLDPGTGQYYLHLFRTEQPDLNWRNPRVADEVDAILRHWLDRGIDGFRIDTAAYLVKHPDLPDNPVLPGGERRPIGGVTAEWRGQDHLYDIHQEDVLAIHRRWRHIADRHDAMLVGEVYELNPERIARYASRDGLHSSFWFGLVESAWDPQRAHTTLLAAARASARLCWVQGNHDRSRSVTRYGGGSLGRARSLALLTVLALLPGTPFLYQGEELGLTDGVVDADATRDPLGRADPSVSRDGARTPMPWSPVPGLGFTSAPAAWIPDGDRAAEDTVAVQDKDFGSYLNAVRRLLRLRGELLRADQTTWSPLKVPGLLGYRRAGVVVLANLTDEPVRLDPAPAGATLFDTHADRLVPGRLLANQAVIMSADL